MGSLGWPTLTKRQRSRGCACFALPGGRWTLAKWLRKPERHVFTRFILCEAPTHRIMPAIYCVLRSYPRAIVTNEDMLERHVVQEALRLPSSFPREDNQEIVQTTPAMFLSAIQSLRSLARISPSNTACFSWHLHWFSWQQCTVEETQKSYL